MSHSEPDRTHGAMRRVGVTLDLSNTSCFAVRWAIDNYIRSGDVVVILHVSLNSLTSLNSVILEHLKYYAMPLVNAHIPYVIHMVEEHDIKKSVKELVCLELDKLGLNSVIMCTRGSNYYDGVGLGPVSGYCAQNCICPVVLVRAPEVSKSVVCITLQEESEDRIITKKVSESSGITEEQRKKLEVVHSKM